MLYIKTANKILSLADRKLSNNSLFTIHYSLFASPSLDTLPIPAYMPSRFLSAPAEILAIFGLRGDGFWEYEITTDSLFGGFYDVCTPLARPRDCTPR